MDFTVVDPCSPGSRQMAPRIDAILDIPGLFFRFKLADPPEMQEIGLL
jgi:hypothetical protein